MNGGLLVHDAEACRRVEKEATPYPSPVQPAICGRWVVADAL